LQHRKGISHHYATLFEQKGADKKAKTIHSKWGWFSTIYELANGNVSNMNGVTELYIEDVLTFLSYEKDVAVQKNISIDANNTRH
jgi:hypothetical protein